MKRILRTISWIFHELPPFAKRHKVLTGIALVLALFVIVVFVPRLPLVGPGGDLRGAQRAQAESDFRGHLIQLIGGLVLAAGAYYTARTFALNREGQITERFTRAVEQLAEDEKLEIRLGGIYALERIAHDSETHYEPVMEVLTAFLREHTRGASESAVANSTSEPTNDGPQEKDEESEAVEPRVDVQAVATAIGRRDRSYEQPGYRLDLRQVDLQGASLYEACLENANLYGADLSDANLHRANLADANLSEAILFGADLPNAVLSGADLSEADISSADLRKVDLTKADLSKADLSGTNLNRANLLLADLHDADLTGASLYEADLSQAKLIRAKLVRAKLPMAKLAGASLFQADLSGADLSGATGITHDQLADAILDATQLPSLPDREAGG